MVEVSTVTVDSSCYKNRFLFTIVDVCDLNHTFCTNVI